MGLLGGSFDPPHIGHLILADEARWRLRLHEVRFVPVATAPHKPDGPSFPAELRARLMAAAIAGDPGFTLSRIELDRSGPSYTADTVEAVAREEPDADLWLIVGGDQLLAFAGWRDPGRILARARLAVAPRPEHDRRVLAAAAAAVAPERVDWIEMPLVGVSSSVVRERLRAGRPVRHLVPCGVADLLADEQRAGLDSPAGRD